MKTAAVAYQYLTDAEIHKKTDGYLLVYPDGQIRFLGFWESIKHRFFGWTAQDFVDEETGAELFRRMCE